MKREYGQRDAYGRARQGEYVYGREERLRLLRIRRRRRAFRKRLLLTAAAVAAAFLLGFSLSGFSGMPSEKTPSYKYYTAVTVHRDDTLWSIASQYMTDEYDSLQDYIGEIREINGMESSKLYYGQKLVVPYYSSEIL